MERKCIICKKSLKNLKELKDYLHFSKGSKVFYICTNDLRSISNKLFDIIKNPTPYLEHLTWLKREKILLEEAKNIYKNCKECYNPRIKLDKIDKKVYDLMCEECWNKFKRIEKKIK